MEEAIIRYISSEFEITVPENFAQEQLEHLLAEKINYLITTDFSSLVNILYRIDVSEQKLKKLLDQNKETGAGSIIASLIIERQLEKIRSRQQSGRDDKNMIDENERW